MIAALSTTTAVLLSAGIGVLGAVLGATASGIATYKIEGQRQTFERRQGLRRERREKEVELAVTRGVARVWSNTLESYIVMLSAVRAVRFSTGAGAEQQAQWWASEFHDPLVPSISLEDRKLIATALTEEEWDKIRQAENAIRMVETTRRLVKADMPVTESGPPLDEGSTEALRVAIESGREAVVVLRAAARAQPVVAPDE
jgi:hypothetical protein